MIFTIYIYVPSIKITEVGNWKSTGRLMEGWA